MHAARLSRVGAGQTGIETQDLGCRAWADANGHEIVHTAADKKSGTVQPWNRRNLRPWVTELEKIAQYDGIVAYRFDRLSRGDDACTSEIEAWAREHRKVLLTEDGLQYPCEGVEGIRWDVTKRIAHEEWLKTSERYKRMQKYLRDGNYLVGKSPFGYQIAASGDHKTLERHPLHAGYVRMAVDRYLSGESLRDVCRWLESEGIMSPSHRRSAPACEARLPSCASEHRWTPSSLARVFRNEALIGRQKNGNGKTVLRLECEPILDRETFGRLQAMLDGKAASRRGMPASGASLLTGIAICGKCDGPMYRMNASNTLKDGTKVPIWYFRCHGTSWSPSTCRNMVQVAYLEEAVTSWITQVMGDYQIAEVRTYHGEGYENEIAEVDQDLRDLDLDAPDYDARHAALRAERTRLKGLPVKPDRVTETLTGQTVSQHWAGLDERGRRAFLLAGEVTLKVTAKDKLSLTCRVSARGEPLWTIPARS